jgi:YHS domain-containing protein
MKILPFFAILGATLGATLLPTSAAPKQEKPKTARTTPSCPKCMMKLSTTKTAMMPAAVKVGGKTYYCCAGCAEHTATQSKGKAHGHNKKAKGKKSAAIPMCPKCNMQMAATPSLLKKTAMKVNGKTYYCCTICPKH